MTLGDSDEEGANFCLNALGQAETLRVGQGPSRRSRSNDWEEVEYGRKCQMILQVLGGGVRTLKQDVAIRVSDDKQGVRAVLRVEATQLRRQVQLQRSVIRNRKRFDKILYLMPKGDFLHDIIKLTDLPVQEHCGHYDRDQRQRGKLQIKLRSN